MFYNVIVKNYGLSTQVQYFEKPIKGVHNNFNYDTGEIYERDKMVTIYNPFDDEVQKVEEFGKTSAEKKLYDNYNRAKHKIYDYARANVWEWFFTFTFSPEKVDRYDYDCVSKKMSQWLKNSRKRYSCSMVYLIVPEQHKDGAWHFHGLFSDCLGLGLVDSGYVDKNGRKIYNVTNFRFGFTTATAVTDTRQVSSYLCKYVTKNVCC